MAFWLGETTALERGGQCGEGFEEKDTSHEKREAGLRCEWGDRHWGGLCQVPGLSPDHRLGPLLGSLFLGSLPDERVSASMLFLLSLG